jgi:hypothetical protein
MKHRRVGLTLATLFLLTAACSEMPTSPAEGPVPAKMVMPGVGPSFTTITSTVVVGNPPLGGVTASEDGSIGSNGGSNYSFSDLQNSNFSFLAWGPADGNAIQISMNGVPSTLAYEGASGSAATWTGTIWFSVFDHSEEIPLRVTIGAAGGMTPVSIVGQPDIPPGVGAVFVVTASSFNANVLAEGLYQGTWTPINELAYTFSGGYGAAPLITFNHTFFAVNAPCPQGKYFVAGTGCVDAPPGSVSSGGTVTSPTLCRSGDYQPLAGQFTCLAAQPGYYATGPGATAQTICPSGTYSSGSGNAQCTTASPGHYAPGPGATFAAACPVGTYAAGSGNTQCSDAPAGYYVSTTGAVAPTACASGFYTSTSGQSACAAAPAGSFAPGPHATGAYLCPVGKFTATSGQASCTDAPAGSFVSTTGATSATPCVGGSYQSLTGQTSCIDAPAGSFATGPGATSATLCAAGYYSATSGQAACTAAPAGSYATGPGATSTSLCAVGTYSTGGQASCTLAPAGSYVSGTGATSATLCAAGTFSASTGQTSCTASPAGSYVALTGRTSSTLCAAGYYQPSTGQTSCIAAAIGFYVSATGSTSQTACPAGMTTSSTGSTACIPIDPVVSYDALITAAQNTPGVSASEVNKLLSARKQLVAGKPSSACKAIDSFMSFVSQQSGKKISVANATFLLQKSQTAKSAIGCV